MEIQQRPLRVLEGEVQEDRKKPPAQEQEVLVDEVAPSGGGPTMGEDREASASRT